jgi:hypothetical protein
MIYQNRLSSKRRSHDCRSVSRCNQNYVMDCNQNGNASLCDEITLRTLKENKIAIVNAFANVEVEQTVRNCLLQLLNGNERHLDILREKGCQSTIEYQRKNNTVKCTYL